MILKGGMMKRRLPEIFKDLSVFTTQKYMKAPNSPSVMTPPSTALEDCDSPNLYKKSQFNFYKSYAQVPGSDQEDQGKNQNYNPSPRTRIEEFRNKKNNELFSKVKNESGSSIVSVVIAAVVSDWLDLSYTVVASGMAMRDLNKEKNEINAFCDAMVEYHK